MLKQLARYRVHLIFAAALSVWPLLGTIAGVSDGDGVFHAFWVSIKEIKPLEWLTMIGLWITMSTLIKQNEELRAKLDGQAGRH